LHELPQFTVAEAVARRRKAVANAMATGLAIPEWRQLDQQAWDEIKLYPDSAEIRQTPLPIAIEAILLHP
jgi:hypothetical protein